MRRDRLDPIQHRDAGALYPVEALHLHRAEDPIFVEQGGGSFVLTCMNPENDHRGFGVLRCDTSLTGIAPLIDDAPE